MSFRIIASAVCVLLVVPSACFSQNSKENADFKLAINLYNDGLYDLAAEQLRQFINSYPNTAEGIDARFTLGLTQLKLKKYDEARLTFQTFALTYQDNPRAPEAWWNVGESYAAVHGYKEAALAYERVKVFHPRSKSAPDALIQAGKYFLLAGERDNARRVLRTVLQEYGSSPAVLTARTQLARIYFDEGNLEQAQTELKRVIDGDPSSDARAQALLILGNVAQATGRPDRAQVQYREIITKYNTTSAIQGAYVNLGKLENAYGRYAEAIENLNKGLNAKGPVDSTLVQEALTEMGDAYASMRDYAHAASCYERLLSSSPGDEREGALLWKLADVSARGKNYRKSNDACNRLLKGKAPDDLKHRAQVRLALNARDQKNFPATVQLLDQFVEEYPDEPSTPRLLFLSAGLAEKELHDQRKAAASYELLTNRYARSPLADDALAGAGRCYEELKEFARALQTYAGLVEKFPASEFRSVAEDRINMIETFEAKDKDAGLEKLALLIGDVVANKDKAGMSFRLGEIYFHDLKNYAAAARQFADAINAGAGNTHAEEALFLRARSLEYLSWKDPKYRPDAIEAYRTFLQTSAANAPAMRMEKSVATLALFLLNSGTLAEARSGAADVPPDAPHRDLVLLRLANLLVAADSTAEALDLYTQVLQDFPDSSSAEEAGYRRLSLLVRAGLPDSAAHAGAEYIAAHPAGRWTAAALSELAALSLQENDVPRAIELYQQLAGDFSYTTLADSARIRLADAYLASANYAEAVSQYTRLIERQSNDLLRDGEVDGSLLLSLGRAQYLGGNLKDAKSVLFRLLARRRTGEIAGEAYATLGMIAKSEGSLEIATSYFRQAGSASPETATSRDIADLLFETGEYADAIKQYTRLAELTQSDSERQYFDFRSILSLLRSGNVGEADKQAAAFSKKYGDDRNDLAAIQLERGNSFFRKEDYARALKEFQHVAGDYDDTPAGPTAMYWVGKTLEASGKPQEALEHYEQLAHDYPGAPIQGRVSIALGNMYYNAEKWDQAIKSYRQVVDDPKADPTLLPLAMSNLIETYETAGIFDAALSLTRKYLERYPNNDDSFDKKIKIGILYERLGYYDQAVLQLQSLLDEAGSDLEGEIRYYIAEANYNKGDYQQAILDFLKVPYLVTKKGKIDWTANSLYMSGQAYEKMGKFDQALTMYQQIIDRAGIDATFKAAAKKEVDRVRLVLKKKAD